MSKVTAAPKLHSSFVRSQKPSEISLEKATG